MVVMGENRISMEQLTRLLTDELRAIAVHSGEVYAIDDQIDVVVVEDYDAHFQRAIERIVATLMLEPVPDMLPDDEEP